ERDLPPVVDHRHQPQADLADHLGPEVQRVARVCPGGERQVRPVARRFDRCHVTIIVYRERDRTRISTRPSTTRVSYAVCGVLAGPCTTSPVSRRNTLACHGHVTVHAASSTVPSCSGPPAWLHR